MCGHEQERCENKLELAINFLNELLKNNNHCDEIHSEDFYNKIEEKLDEIMRIQ
jgi:hypothetical protein